MIYVDTIIAVVIVLMALVTVAILVSGVWKG